MFKLYRVEGARLNPESRGGSEPRLNDIWELWNNGQLRVEEREMEAAIVGTETLWLSLETHRKASSLLDIGRAYEAHEGATVTACKGAWVIRGEVIDVEPPIGAPKDRKYVLVSTELSEKLGLDPFVVEKDFVFEYVKGEDIALGKVVRKRHALLAYNRSGNPLSKDELENTLLWKSYLSKAEVRKVIETSSKHMKKTWWHIERMKPMALSRIKVVWKDVAKRFVPAVDIDGLIPDYTVNYITVKSLEEAYYLLAILLSPQVNAVVEEISPWIGHVQPRFIRYFRIPPYNPKREAHKKLEEIGKKVYIKGNLEDADIRKLEELVEQLHCR